MNHDAQNLEIYIHKLDGSVERFIQSETALAERILTEIQPARMFVREKIIIADGNSLTSFPARQVVRIDLVSEPSSTLILPPGIVEAEEFTEAEWRARLQTAERCDSYEAQSRDSLVVVFLNIKMAGQRPLFLALESPLHLLADQPEAILYPLYPLAAPTLCFRMRTGGIAILNLAHLMHFTLFPTPPSIPMVTWLAHWAKNPKLDEPAHDLPKSTGIPISIQAAG